MKKIRGVLLSGANFNSCSDFGHSVRYKLQWCILLNTMFNRTVFMVKNEQFVQFSVRKNCKTSTMRDILSRIWIHQLSVICGNEACKALANRKFVLSGFSPWWRKNPSSLTVSCETFFHLCRTDFPRILHFSLHESCFLLLGNNYIQSQRCKT